MRTASLSLLCYRRDACPRCSCGWLRRCTCSVQPSSIFPFRPLLTRLILPTSSFPTSLLHSSRRHSHTSRLTRSLSRLLSHAFFPPRFSQTHSHSLTRQTTFHTTSPTLIMGPSCVPDPDPSFLALFPSLPFSEMSPCRHVVQPLKQTPLRGACFDTTHRCGMLWGASQFVFWRADVFQKTRTGTSQKTRRRDDEIGKVVGASDVKTNLKVGIV